VSKRVLIVEDSPAMRQLLLFAVRRFPGVQVDEAPDGVAALKAIAQAPYDVLFVDLNMPMLDGLKLIRRVREDPRQAQTRIVVVTTEESAEVEQQARELGATHYLRKPVQRHAIEEVLRTALGES
jgi:two-component system chemotaxis response regulator CheY